MPQGNIISKNYLTPLCRPNPRPDNSPPGFVYAIDGVLSLAPRGGPSGEADGSGGLPNHPFGFLEWAIEMAHVPDRQGLKENGFVERADAIR